MQGKSITLVLSRKLPRHWALLLECAVCKLETEPLVPLASPAKPS